MSDFLTITADNAPIQPPQTTRDTGPDPRLWKPRVSKEKTTYEAQIRMLPRGVDGLKNRLFPTVKILTHHLADPITKVFRKVRCRKTLGDNEQCPVCEAAWAIYNEGKAKNDDLLMQKGKDQLPRTTHIGNFLIRNDIQLPNLNGVVKLWEHTNPVNNMLIAPTIEAPEGDKPTIKKKKEVFYPYAPKNGRDFLVYVSRNPTNGFPVYTESTWDDTPSDIAETEAEMLAILDKCYDLSEFMVVPSIEEAANLYNQFISTVSSREVARSSMMAQQQNQQQQQQPSINATMHTQAQQDNAKAFFNKASAESVTPMSTPTAPIIEPEYGDEMADDEELPF